MCQVIDDHLINIRPMPEADPGKGTPEGMYILQRLPEGTIKPMPFVEGARRSLEKLCSDMDKSFRRMSPEAANEWQSFLAEAPDTDDANDWVARHPLLVPLSDILCARTLPRAPLQQAGAARLYNHRSRISEPLDSVNWSRRGQKRARGDPAAHGSSRVIQGPAGVIRSVPIDYMNTAAGRRAGATVASESDSDSGDECKSEDSEEQRAKFVSAPRPTRGPSLKYFEKIGRRFIDEEEDDQRYRIVDVCVSEAYPGLFFKYVADDVDEDPSDHDDYEYTSCKEIMSGKWAKWINDVRK
jgi:hypothetical protein